MAYKEKNIERCFKKRPFFLLFTLLVIQPVIATLFIFNPRQAVAETWTREDANTIVISSVNYDAYCDKTTGLCDFFNKSGEKLFQNAGNTYVGYWQGSEEFGSAQERFDENYIRRGDYIVSASNLSEGGNTATVTFSQTKPGEVQFDTTYTFCQNDPQVSVNCRITYLDEKYVTNEIIKTGVPDAFSIVTVEPFESANLINEVQIDNMDDITGWSNGGNGAVAFEKNIDPNYIKEGNGSVKVIFTNDNDGNNNEESAIIKSYYSTDYPNKTHMSFWIYPLNKIWLYVTLYFDGGSQETRTINFPANQWSLVQWDFKRSFGLNGLKGFYKIKLAMEETYLPAQYVPVYIDNIRFSDDIEYGIMSSVGQGDGLDCWRGTGDSGSTIDEQFYHNGNGSFKWADLNLVSTGMLLYQYTVEKDTLKANPDLPVDISGYDYVVFDSYTPYNVNVGFMLSDVNGATSYQDYNIPTGTWQTIKGDFKKEFWGDIIDHNHIEAYYFYTRKNTGVANGTIWLDDLRLVKLENNGLVFDSNRDAYERDGKATKYSSRVFKMNNQTYIYGDNFGASSIEYMDKNPADETVDCYIYKVDMHNFKTQVARDGNEKAGLTFYKETVREIGNTSEGTIVYRFNTSQPTEIIKSRWPRNFDAAYSISEDDFYFNASKAYYCGTSDACSSDYGYRGIIGHNLRTTNNLWYYMTNSDGGGTYKDHPKIEEFFNLMYDNGIEIAIHTPGIVEDSRSIAIEALDNLVARYQTRNWADHYSGGNPEDFQRTGAFPMLGGNPNDGNDGYYMLDLLKARGFSYIWPITNPLPSGATTSNLFYPGYKEVCPLPYRSQIIDKTGGSRVIYLYGRGGGNGGNEFLKAGCGGNTEDLEDMIKNHGLTLVYTHSHIDYYTIKGSDYVLKDTVDDVFNWLDTKHREGSLWVDTVSNILDWMIYLENVSITSQTGNTVTVKNNNDSALSGVTLEVLDSNINCAKIDNLYQICVDGSSVVLPKLSGGESKTVEIVPGIYDSSLPRLTQLPTYVKVDFAQYDPNTKIVSLGFDYQEIPGAMTTPIAPVIDNYRCPFLNATSMVSAAGNTQVITTLPASPTTFNAVDMQITPSSNSIGVIIDTWETSSDCVRRWTETTDDTVSVCHIMGDLIEDAYYVVKIDGTFHSICFSNHSGQISFTFNYDDIGEQTHTAEIELSTSPDVDLSGRVDMADFAKLAMYWMTAEPSVDIAPPPHGDGVVDIQDLAFLVEYWLEDMRQ